MKYLLTRLILIGFSTTAFARYMGNISNHTLEFTISPAGSSMESVLKGNENVDTGSLEDLNLD